jgi:hypothetical protein
LARNKIGHVCLINLSKVQADDDSWFWILGQTFVVVKDAVRRTMLSPVICSSCLQRSQSGKQGDGEHSQAENDSRYPSYFDVGKPSPS